MLKNHVLLWVQFRAGLQSGLAREDGRNTAMVLWRQGVQVNAKELGVREAPGAGVQNVFAHIWDVPRQGTHPSYWNQYQGMPSRRMTLFVLKIVQWEHA